MTNFLKSIPNIIFPSLCFSCRDYSPRQMPLCPACHGKLKEAGRSTLTKRILPFTSPSLRSHITDISLFCCFHYTPPLKELLHHFKYHAHYTYLDGYIMELILSSLRHHSFDCSAYDGITFVPMHSLTLREREFNHAELIARGISQRYDLPLIDDLLWVRKPYRLQSHLNSNERRINPLQKFVLRNTDQAWTGKNIIIYDDVFTTGTTVLACVQELLALNLKKILILTLAKA